MKNDYKYLKQLGQSFPDVLSAAEEVINLEAILHLPKGTEHYLSDIHGEHEAFFHVVKNASGTIRRKIDEALANTISFKDKQELATIIYYPKEKLARLKVAGLLDDDMLKITLNRLIKVCKLVCSKYTRSKVRRSLPKSYAYIIEELMTEGPTRVNKGEYFDAIISSMIDLGNAEDFIIQISNLIQKMAIDRLHIIGDIFDRGPGPHFIMDYLCEHNSFDVQWGNHDVVWMGAALGHMPCIANIIRNSLRYDGLDILEDGYGINMTPLLEFAAIAYADDPCLCYKVKDKEITKDRHMQLTLKMHKAISVIQWKVEGQLISRRPEYNMDDRRLLHLINYENGTITLDGKEYELKDKLYPTIDPNDPYKLTSEEEKLVHYLSASFYQCEKLNKHAELLIHKGSLYLIYNNMMMFHGCIPMTEDGDFREVNVYGKKCKGKELMDELDSYVRKAFLADSKEEREKGADILWYLWNAPDSPIFGKSRMATFERYLIAEEETWTEVKDPYYSLVKNDNVLDGENIPVSEKAVNAIFEEFDLDGEKAKIINGHVPVKHKNGESPVKANGKVVVIDGGFAKTYHKDTGIAGYTYIYNSDGMILVAHKPFTTTENAIDDCYDIVSELVADDNIKGRVYIADTDTGVELKTRIEDLKELIECYKNGIIKETRKD